MEIDTDDLLVKKVRKKGFGVFARHPFARGTVLLSFDGPVLTAEQILVGSFEHDHIIKNSPTTFLGPSGKIDDYVNHSCDPNCAVKESGGKLLLVAILDIKKGEEVTFDYSTVISDAWEKEITCFCGASICRGKVERFQLLPDSLKRRYMRLGIVPTYIHDAR